MPKSGKCKIFGCPIFQGIQQYIQITTKNMYLLIEIRFTILIQCYGNYIIICLKLTFSEIPFKFFQVSGVAIFDGLGVQMTPRGPAG